MRMSPSLPIPLLLLLLLLLLSMMITTTTTTTTPECHEALQNLDGMQPAIRGVSELGFKFLKELTNKDNLVISPYTLWKVLSTLSAGAEGNTLKQILSVLGLKEKKAIIHLLNTLNQRVIEKAKEENLEIPLYEANQIYMKNGLDLKKCQKELSGLISHIDFTQPEKAAQTINNFFKSETQGLISKVLKTMVIEPETRGLSFSGLYFQHVWKEPFDEELTSKKNFYLRAGEEPVLVDTMRGKDMSIGKGWSEDLKAEVIQLDITGKKSSSYMYILLPQNVPSGFNVTLNSLSDENFRKAIGRLTRKDCKIEIPKFRIETTLIKEIEGAMAKLGLKDVVGPGADLSSFHDDFYLNHLSHFASIKISEKGTIAASNATLTVLSTGIGSTGGLRKICSININRPFIFVLFREGVPLFTGTVMKP